MLSLPVSSSFCWWGVGRFRISPEEQNGDEKQRHYKDVSGDINHRPPYRCLLRCCADQRGIEAGNNKVRAAADGNGGDDLATWNVEHDDVATRQRHKAK